MNTPKDINGIHATGKVVKTETGYMAFGTMAGVNSNQCLEIFNLKNYGPGEILCMIPPDSSIWAE